MGMCDHLPTYTRCMLCLQDRFGVAMPSKSLPGPGALSSASTAGAATSGEATGAHTGGQMAKGLTPAAAPSVILPK